MVTYKQSGVDIDKSNEAKKRLKSFVHNTFSKDVLTDIGAFGGLYRFDSKQYDDPVLVASSDGVGTKLKLAVKSGIYSTIGQDLVNHCVNDILSMGAKPLFFLDYVALGKMQPQVVEQIVLGLSKACRENSCSLIGGETAEMPGIYKTGDFDLAGFIVGVVERGEIIDGKKISEGDIIVGLSSTGLQTNGYSLANKVIFDLGGYVLEDRPAELNGKSIKEAMMAVHQSFLKPVTKLRQEGINIKGMAHITGGGLPENIPRILPKKYDALLDAKSWEVPSLFNLIKRLGNVPDDDMLRTFNMGIGFVIVIDAQEQFRASNILTAMKTGHHIIGKIVRGKGKVLFKN